MKRFLAIGFIAVYIGVLSYGNICHFLDFRKTAHPLMYMIVWDMFCGWSAFETRIHIFAEGEDDKFYDLTHPPWGELHPYGYIGRENYDQNQNHTGTMGLNVLRHTRHVPVSRVFVVEECWAKKYNMPDDVWMARYDGPKDKHSYFRVRVVLLPDGTITQAYSAWVAFQSSQMMMDNPRLQERSRLSRPMFVIDNFKPGREAIAGPAADNSPLGTIRAPSGN